MRCLIPNIGSTSFKYRVLDMPGETVLVEGRVERIGQPGGECPDYRSAIAKCLAAIAGEGKALKNLCTIQGKSFNSKPRHVDAKILLNRQPYFGVESLRERRD